MSTRNPFRAALSFAGAVLMVAGALLIAEITVTLLWQEPLSALVAKSKQSALERRLERVTADLRAGAPADPPSRLARLEASRLEPGDPVGRISMPTLDRSYVVVQGTDAAQLRAGPGHYEDTALPGQGRTIAIAGHRTTFGAPFRTIDQLRRGDPIILEMPYGQFRYSVTGSRVVSPQAVSVKRDTGSERVVLTACHPLYSASKRLIVFARSSGESPAP